MHACDITEYALLVRPGRILNVYYRNTHACSLKASHNAKCQSFQAYYNMYASSDYIYADHTHTLCSSPEKQCIAISIYFVIPHQYEHSQIQLVDTSHDIRQAALFMKTLRDA